MLYNRNSITIAILWPGCGEKKGRSERSDQRRASLKHIDVLKTELLAGLPLPTKNLVVRGWELLAKERYFGVCSSKKVSTERSAYRGIMNHCSRVLLTRLRLIIRSVNIAWHNRRLYWMARGSHRQYILQCAEIPQVFPCPF